MWHNTGRVGLSKVRTRHGLGSGPILAAMPVGGGSAAPASDRQRRQGALIAGRSVERVPKPVMNERTYALRYVIDI